MNKENIIPSESRLNIWSCSAPWSGTRWVRMSTAVSLSRRLSSVILLCREEGNSCWAMHSVVINSTQQYCSSAAMAQPVIKAGRQAGHAH